jgi:hypothetical protein
MSSFLPRLSRREWLKLSTAGVLGYSMSGWLERLAADTADDKNRKRSCILLWMAGGPSTIDLWDLKTGHANGGPYKPIDTSADGVQIGEHLPKMAQHMDRAAIIRGMSTKEADHGRATYLMRTGRAPGAGGPVLYPTLGSFVSKELERPDAELPSFVSVGPSRFLSPEAYGAGFLGPRHAPLIVGEDGAGFVVNGQRGNDVDVQLKVADLDLPRGVDNRRAANRVKLLDDQEQDFLRDRDGVSSQSHNTAYRRAVTMMRSKAVEAFNLSEEPAKLRDSYGRNLFGQGCLLARRLVERSVPFIEVTLNGWDTHQQNFDQVKRLCGVLDPAWSTLMSDLKDKGLLDSTLVVWMGEFGRTPKINGGQGRDHWAVSWSTVLAGGGIKGGQAVGKTNESGMEVVERPTSTPDLLATVCCALGVDPTKQNASNVGRPIRLVEPGAKAIKEVLA